MHRNYFVIRQLGIALQQKLGQSVFDNAFSTGKDELFLVFKRAQDFFSIRISFDSGQVYFRFPDELHMPSKAMHWYRNLEEKALLSVCTPRFDRQLFFKLKDKSEIQLRLYSPKPDVLAVQGDLAESFRYRNQPEASTADVSYDEPGLALPTSHIPDEKGLLKLYPYFKGDIAKQLSMEGLYEQAFEQQQITLQSCWEYLMHPQFYYSPEKFSIYEFKGSGKSDDVLVALDTFSSEYLREHHLRQQKDQLLKRTEAELRKTDKSIEAAEQRKRELGSEIPLEQKAHILMANLHQVPQGASETLLHDFYRNADIRIRLNPKLNAQQNAELLYKKAKNRHLEVESVEKKIDVLRNRRDELELKLERIRTSDDRQLLRKMNQEIAVSSQEEHLPYREYELMGWKIWVGKSAKANDELISTYAKKNDYWLHARNFAGSHVIIKSQSGKVIPKPVLEKAASLAAWYSKGKTEGLCPVIYTERKYIRKPKGAAPGQVLVEKEQVLMVRPSAD